MRGGRRSTSIKRGEVRNPLGKNQYTPGAAAAAKKIIADVRELAKELTPKAMMALEAVLDNEKAPPAAKVSAASVILDRAWGRPQQDVSVTSTFDVADRIINRWKANLVQLDAAEPKVIEARANRSP
jgi:predicted lipid-binding transport protein (Tim44 family)